MLRKGKVSRQIVDVHEPFRTILNEWAFRERRKFKAHYEYLLEALALLYQQEPAIAERLHVLRSSREQA